MSKQADPQPVLELIQGFRRSKIMFTSVSLGIFDQLSSGPATASEVACGLSTNASATARLLDACVGLGLLARSGDRYSNTDVAATYLTTTSPHRMTGYIKSSNHGGWKLWGCLDDAIREGTHRWEQVEGIEGPLFKHFFRSENDKREFLMGMHGFGMISSPVIAKAVDLSRFRHLCDLGGATGHLAIAACRQYPQLTATVFDLPDAVPLANEIVSATEVVSRITVQAGDFFEDPLPPADLYTLGRIVHDWTEEKIDRLLARIYEALPSGGAMLICEKIINDNRDGPSWAQMQDINMLVCTEGRERTAAEYVDLCHKHGFSSVDVTVTDSPIDGVLAMKP